MSFTYITGSGTQADPYVISDKNGWSEFCNHVNNGNSMVGQFVELSADIRYNDSNENKNEYSRRNYSESTPTIGIEYNESAIYGMSFRGDFNGNNHTIYGIDVTSTGSVISASNGAHIHHVRFEKILSKTDKRGTGNDYYRRTPFHSCISVNCSTRIAPYDVSTHIKENGAYVTLNDIVCSGSVNFATVTNGSFVTLKNILYSCDNISSGFRDNNWYEKDGDELPYYLVEVTCMYAWSTTITRLNVNKTITENYSEVLKRMMYATGIDYIIKDDEIYTLNQNVETQFTIKPTISINNCTAYNAFIINPDCVRTESREAQHGRQVTKLDFQYIIRESVSYFPDSEFFNHRLIDYSEIKPQNLSNLCMHRLKFSIRDQIRGYFLYESDINEELYCYYLNDNMYDSTKPMMTGDVVYVNGVIRVENIYEYEDYICYLDGDITISDSLKKPLVLVSNMQNTYINSLREIISEQEGYSYTTTDSIPQLVNSTTMSFSSDLNCYVPLQFVNDYVYWNIKSTPDNYRFFVCNNSGGDYTLILWCVGNIGLIRKGTDVNFGVGCVDTYKIPFLSATFTANGSSISYTFDENECHSETYSNVSASMLIDLSIYFEHNMVGNGTSQSPFLIATESDLEGFLTVIHYIGLESNLSNVKRYFKDSYFKLTNDITLQNQSQINSLYTPDNGVYFGFTIGDTDINYSNPSRDGYYGCFCGTLDGNNHSIIGLFDQYFHMSEYAVIKNLYFVVCNIVFFMNSENLSNDIRYRSENPPLIIDSYISGYIDFVIDMGHIRRCVIHNLKYGMAGYNMVASDHYPYNITDENWNEETYPGSGVYKFPPPFVEPDVEFSDCLFMENASNILPTKCFSRMTYDENNITGDIAVGKSIITPCYNMYNNVYIGIYENAIFSPYNITCEDRFHGELYDKADYSDEIIIMQENRKEIVNTYKNKYRTLYIKSSSLLRHERVNNCGNIIDDEDWNSESSFRTLDFTSTWKMTEIGPVPKKLNIVTHSISVSCSNIYLNFFEIREINKIGTYSSYTSDYMYLISNTPEHLTFLKWDDNDSANASRSFNYGANNSLWITYSMRTNEEYSGGNGTKNNPYQISDVNDMYDFLSFHSDDNEPASFGFMPYTYYVLTNDLEMNDVSDYDILNPEPYEDYTPVRKMLYGEFDGRGHRISGLNPQMLEFPSDDDDDEGWSNIPDTTMGDWIGISSFILHFSGKLKNLTIDKVYIPKTENALICGGIVCYAYSGNNPDVTEITNCKFMGVIDHCYQIGLCGGLFAVNADSLCYENFLTPLWCGETCLLPFEQETMYWYSLVYETFFMNLDTQRIVVDNCTTVGSIRMSDVISNDDVFNSYLFQCINENLPSEISLSLKSWCVFKFTSGIFNYCYLQGLPVYIQNTINNMNIEGIISSALCTIMNLHKNLPVFIEKSYNTGNIAPASILSTLSVEQPYAFTASGIIMAFNPSYINVKNCYNNGEISAYTASGICIPVSSDLYQVYLDYEKEHQYSTFGIFWYMPNWFYMEYNIENCYNYNDITPLFNSEHTYAIQPPFYIDYYETEPICEPINCYSLENTTTDDTNNAVTYLTSDEFKVKSNFTGWDFNNTWVSPTAKNRPLLSENLEGDNLYRLKLSVNNKGFGTATGDGVYEENTIVELLAVPFTSYKFEGWSDGNKKNPRNYIVDHNEYIQAIFRFDGYSIRLLDYEGLKRFLNNMKTYIKEENDKKVDIIMAGDSDTPVYFNSAGIPTPCTSLDLDTSGNAGTATKLETTRTINGVPFDGTTDIALAPSNIGLGNVNNTSDMDKPISTATQNALMVLEDDITGITYDNITYHMIDDIFNE